MLLKPEAVRALSGVSSKKRLMNELGALADAAYAVPHAAAVDALMERESLGPTGVGNGVALPHARLEGLDRVVGALVVLDKPIPFDAVDRQPVDLFFALFAPLDSGVEHLKALARVSRVFRREDIRSRLRSTEARDGMSAILLQETSSDAA